MANLQVQSLLSIIWRKWIHGCIIDRAVLSNTFYSTSSKWNHLSLTYRSGVLSKYDDGSLIFLTVVGLVLRLMTFLFILVNRILFQ